MSEMEGNPGWAFTEDHRNRSLTTPFVNSRTTNLIYLGGKPAYAFLNKATGEGLNEEKTCNTVKKTL